MSHPLSALVEGGTFYQSRHATAAGFSALDAATSAVQLTPLANPTTSIPVLIPAWACIHLQLGRHRDHPAAVDWLATGAVTPPIGVSSGSGTIATALCPGTWDGPVQVQAVLSGTAGN